MAFLVIVVASASPRQYACEGYSCQQRSQQLQVSSWLHFPISDTHGDCSLALSFRNRAPIDPLGDRPRNSQHAISSSSRLLSNPFRHARLMLNQLPNKLARKAPHRRQFFNGIVTLFERVRRFDWLAAHR